jgi:thiol-disulfide isomerase/thioredoxin
MVNLGEKAPELIVSDWLVGSTIKLEDLNGKFVLLHFFQTNCPGCFAYSLPETEKLHRKYGERGLEVVGVVVRFEEYNINTIPNTKAFLESGKLTDKVKEVLANKMPNLLDENGNFNAKITHRIGWDKGEAESYSETFKVYNPPGTPMEYLIDREGRIIGMDHWLSSDPRLIEFLDAQLGK